MGAFAAANPVVEEMTTRFATEAAVNLLNLVDHWALHDTPALRQQLAALGLVEQDADGLPVWAHPQARLPRVRLLPETPHPALALAVDDVQAFLSANALMARSRAGDPDSAYEEARVALPHGELLIVARRGYVGFEPGQMTAACQDSLRAARAAFARRPREGDEEAVTDEARKRAQRAVQTLGAGRAADEFFAAERAYYTARNKAAQWQLAQQNALGIGWANHDHHTYRSSRASFQSLMGMWDVLGFDARERFYAGADAGWGAQVLEHPTSRVVLFCDVDIAPEELAIDFAHEMLAPRDSLGTIGLWCALHGSSIGAGGMHHLECEFHFQQARDNFTQAGFPVMKPFTDLPMLKQAFTSPELWPVRRERLDALRLLGAITPEQAASFASNGAAGSHLEILQRWEGFKGFNKTGVSAIIRETDARRAAGVA